MAVSVFLVTQAKIYFLSSFDIPHQSVNTVRFTFTILDIENLNTSHHLPFYFLHPSSIIFYILTCIILMTSQLDPLLSFPLYICSQHRDWRDLFKLQIRASQKLEIFTIGKCILKTVLNPQWNITQSHLLEELLFEKPRRPFQTGLTFHLPLLMADGAYGSAWEQEDKLLTQGKAALSPRISPFHLALSVHCLTLCSLSHSCCRLWLGSRSPW